VLAIGNPLGLTHTVTAGIVSAKGRFLKEGGRGFGRNYQAQDYVDFIQTDASINQGNSGGPLFNLKGEVVGINTAVSRAGQGIGFAVPIDLVQSILEDLKGGGKITRGWLGISLQSLDEHLARALEVKSDSGALIQQVGMGTPAEGAGLKPGDVITAIDGDTVADHEEVVRRIGLMRAGQAVKLTILRKGKRKIYEVTLGQRQTQLKLRENGDEGAQDPQTPETAGALPGLRLETRRGLGQVSAVVVTGVERTSSAFGRLRVGDEIVEINRARVQSSQEAERLLKRADGVALLLVNREGRRSFVAVPVR
jgi:serine protease Do